MSATLKIRLVNKNSYSLSVAVWLSTVCDWTHVYILWYGIRYYAYYCRSTVLNNKSIECE